MGKVVFSLEKWLKSDYVQFSLPYFHGVFGIGDLLFDIWSFVYMVFLMVLLVFGVCIRHFIWSIWQLVFVYFVSLPCPAILCPPWSSASPRPCCSGFCFRYSATSSSLEIGQKCNKTFFALAQFEHTRFILTTLGFSVEEMHLKCSSKMDLLDVEWGWIVDGVKLEPPASGINFFSNLWWKKKPKPVFEPKQRLLWWGLFPLKKRLPRIS